MEASGGLHGTLGEGVRVLEGVQVLEGVRVLCGIPTFNNAATVGKVVTAVSEGLDRLGVKGGIAISDGRSTDGTAARALGAGAGPRVPTAAILYSGPPGKGSALRAVFGLAERLGVRACAVFDADLRSITPVWVERLLGPALDGKADLVTPLYSRDRADGTITNAIACPLTAALYGVMVRQPIGGDFGFSGALAARWAAEPVWESDVARFGIDAWMTTTAILWGSTVAQAPLGAKVHDPKDPGADLAPMFRQVVSTIFALAEAHEPAWRRVERIERAPVIGDPADGRPEAVRIDPDAMERRARGALRAATGAFPGLSERIERALGVPVDVDQSLWVDAVVAAMRAPDRRAAVDGLFPLYLGRTTTFLRSERSADDEVEVLAAMFLAAKAGA
ncbi:MAG TPA: glycosyltransferase [Actinomycetota bacterium]